jgi:hypothetical protein
VALSLPKISAVLQFFQSFQLILETSGVSTVRVIEGNASLLKACATSPAYYLEVQQASQLNAVFKSIADSLATMRISK